ncbi:FHA domain-containing protein [Dyadobacter pollutisoli]|uniref:FHA domain-containing protein n=1 Tax=Dyadobacter pollutisoli TaxID=2910158 RepID=A0A9E8N7W3_9BACT|nr:FHA domain-containing protein [Dyadobacter pollutisoli]WAC10147.1 FHA domain-containing protein [Dyadobacter pollutisoli]
MKPQKLRIGRKPDNDIVVDDPSVSGYHALATLGDGNSAILEDNDSSNGTYVDGVRIRKTQFTTGSKIILGKIPFDPGKIFRFDKKPDDFIHEFSELHPVWLVLEKERVDLIEIQKKMDVLLAIPYIGRLIILLMNRHYDLENRRVKWKENMRRQWNCPGCQQPLRDYDWLTWNDCEHLKKCPKCKVKWF